MMEEIEKSNQEKVRSLGEKKTYSGVLEADTIKQLEMKEKNLKDYINKTKKLLETKLFSRNLIKWINTFAVTLVRYSRPFLKSTRKELKTNGPENPKNSWRCKRTYIPEMTLTDSMCQEKKEKEDPPALRIASMHRYNDSKNALKSADEDWLQQPEIIQTTQASTEQQ